MVFFLLSSFIIVIVLMNMLIAIMSDTYEDMMEKGNLLTMKARISVLLEIERDMSDADLRKPEWFPRYVQVLEPLAGPKDMDAYIGRRRMAEETAESKRSRARLAAGVAQLDERLQQLEDTVLHVQKSSEQTQTSVQDMQTNAQEMQASINKNAQEMQASINKVEAMLHMLTTDKQAS